MKNNRTKFLSSAVIILFLALAYGSSNNESSATKSTTSSSSSSSQWYEGGTLHRAKISEWKSATTKNKLATCADFMAKYDNTVSMDVLKTRSINLKNCIDEATRGLESTNTESVSSIAALCTKTLY